MQRKDIALKAVTVASQFLRKHYQVIRTGTEKADGSLVSEADHGSEERILKLIQKNFPDDAILSEERGKIEGTSGYRWIIDPLDGTHNFLAGIPLFGTLLALEQHGEIILSCCAFPLLQELFFAEKGKGAFCNGKHIQVSSVSSFKGNTFLTDVNTRMNFDDAMKEFRPFHGNGARFRFLGQGAFGLTRVALGTIPAASRKGEAWDTAAPAFLVEEAGGKVTDQKGNPWDVKTYALVATNGLVHDEVLGMLSR